MKLYLLKRAGRTGYDEMVAQLVRAESEDRARVISNSNTGDEGPIWANKEKTLCFEITTEGKEEIIMIDYHAG